MCRARAHEHVHVNESLNKHQSVQVFDFVCFWWFCGACEGLGLVAYRLSLKCKVLILFVKHAFATMSTLHFKEIE